MENPTLLQPSPSQQPQQQQSQPCQSTSSQAASQQTQSGKNVRNLSIKEFFTTRLMRARSFEGGGHSPKDESTNWFDEFKARMTKKSQANQAKQNIQSSGDVTGMDDSADEDLPGTNPKHIRMVRLNQHVGDKDDHGSHIVKDVCDNNLLLGRLSESAEELIERPTVKSSELTPIETPTTTASSKSAKTRKHNKISTVDSPDFDTASIHTIFNRRDSRYDKLRGGKASLLSASRLTTYLRKLFSYVMPLDYNLPWKLLTIINVTFMIIVLAVASEVSPKFMTLTFFNGFISGILVATICFFILVLSFVTQILPPSCENSPVPTTKKSSNSFRSRQANSVRSPNVSFIEQSKVSKHRVSFESTNPKPEDTYSQIEMLCDENQDPDETARGDNILDDDDYKGWMIEFVGDYEQRNKSEFKLKLIYVKIEDRVLHLCKPKNNHDAESATFPVFVQQRTYDLNTAKKFSASLLLPKTVRNRQKWVWSKKYPIRLEFLDEGEPTSIANKSPPEANPKMMQLTLFAKSCREKEEWFRRFKKVVEAYRINPTSSTKRGSLSSENASKNEDPLMEGLASDSRSISPSLSLRVQTSRSSHMIGGMKQFAQDDSNPQEVGSTSKIIRTKSCEVLNDERSLSNEPSIASSERCEESNVRYSQPDPEDDSTLTRETANLFSQAIEYSNFIDSQPTLDYKEYIERVIDSSQEAKATSDWFNALIGRILFDVFSHSYWSHWFKRKIQRKLYRIRLPYFMETLTLTKIDLGSNAPQLLNVVSHSFDSFGLSIDFDMAYSGGLTMTFETKLNLLKIKADNSSASNSSNNATSNISTQQANLNSSASTSTSLSSSQQPIEQSSKDSSSMPGVFSMDSLNAKDDGASKVSTSSAGSTRTSGESSESDDSEDDSSSDSSFDEAEVDEISDWEDYGAEKTRQSIVKFVDKIASSRYFQHAKENRYIKKKLQDISNCPLVLIVQIQSLNGVLTVNVPPPQTNRIWYGFKPNPELTLKALPKMGDRELNLSHVTDWIERKLAEEFRKILVIPNMEDIVLPVLKSDHLLYVSSTK